TVGGTFLSPGTAVNSGWEGIMPDAYLEETRNLFLGCKQIAEAAITQVADGDLLHCLDGESNSIAMIAQHISGNLRSCWTDFLTPDGEKPDRHRASEFEPRSATRAELVASWERGWSSLFAALDSLSPPDLSRTVYIRGEAHSVLKAIQRSLAHTSGHVG